MKNFLVALVIFTFAACGGSGSGASASVAPGPSSSGATQISEIQGSGASSSLDGQTVSISAIVSGDFQDDDLDVTRNLAGFYVQQEIPDADPTTSEGVFVFDGANPATDVSVGDRVVVTGVVAEYFGETQIKATSVIVTGTGMVQATDINLPANGLVANSDGEKIADLEMYEGMLVHFPQTLAVSGLRFLEQYGEVELSEGGRLYQFTTSNGPDAGAYAAHVAAIAARSIILDDGLRESNPTTIRHLHAGVAADYSIRAGDSISGATGNLRYSRGSGGGGKEGWRLELTDNLSFDDDNPRPGPPSVAGSLRVASFNVLNFFSKVDSGQAICGPGGDDRCRGADSATEMSRQLEKTVTAIALMEADIIGLIELENNAADSIATIVNALNARVGSGNYAFVDTGTIHTDAIKTGFIYDASRVRTKSSFALLDAGVDPRFRDTHSRPALAQSFELVSTGAVLTVVVNHLKSKASSCETIGDPNVNDGQSNCNITRRQAAAAIADWVNTDPTASGDDDVLVIGDLNAYMMEDPLVAFRSAGYTSLLDRNPNAYSYVFDAQAGAIDHALASASLVAQVRETIEWHINADEPQLLDYNLENGRDANLFDPNIPYRTSDHDPLIIGLELTH
ncbi:MAG: ExeM/NucH family extracellular endonuclease [Woeseiaceae bacterium]|nr:ExeM/NucH family extracellular endonuclease [Woeseiaceae bacterium]